ncbi:MAG: CPBP family intramembrane metalloprotease [Saprospiraceae bacterium]|nr:CPBP family intramembrane metalloprotease [Saprospiraceae bacterium]
MDELQADNPDLLPEPEENKFEPPRYDWPPPYILILLLTAILVGSVLGALLAEMICRLNGTTVEMLINSLNIDSPLADRNLSRWVNGAAHIATFTLPALAVAIALYRRRWAPFLAIDKSPDFRYLLAGVLLIVSAFPLVQWLYWVNKTYIPMPEAWRQLESSTQDMVEALLVMNSPGEFWLSIFIVAVLPAIGEELLFRGVLQPQLERWFRQPHLAIAITALVFSIIHFQFEGFLPRFALGVVLGYLAWWSRSLWPAIVAHFAFNGVQVLATFLFAEEIDKAKLEEQSPNLVIVLTSIVVMVAIGQYLKKTNLQRQ